MNTNDSDSLCERFRKLARLAKDNGNEGAVAAERAAAMLREHGDAVLQPPRSSFEEFLEVLAVTRAPFVDFNFRRGTMKWGTAEEKAALEDLGARERAAAQEAWRAEERAEARAEARERRERKKREKAERVEAERRHAEEAAKSPAQRAAEAAEAAEAERVERAEWEAERERRRVRAPVGV